MLNGAIAAIIVADVHAHLHEQDQEYFRTSREKAFGRTLEEVVADRETNLPAFRRAIDPIRGMLRNQPFLGGDAPSYADYIPFGSLQWARAISPVQLLEPGDPVHGWRDRLLDAFGGLARNSLAYA